MNLLDEILSYAVIVLKQVIKPHKCPYFLNVQITAFTEASYSVGIFHFAAISDRKPNG
jgi:hypothetical protein